MTENPALLPKAFSWAGFFADAGLPPSVCANYAVLFIDNRMKKSMIPDITKEILHELGIRAVGDVISILRYAKSNTTDSPNSKLKTSAQSRSVDRSEKMKDLERNQTRVGSKEITSTGSRKEKDPERSKGRRESVSSRQSIGADSIKRTSQRMQQKERKVESSPSSKPSSSKVLSGGSKSQKYPKVPHSHRPSHSKSTFKKRRVSKAGDIEVSDSDSETESMRREKVPKKRKVVMEEVSMASRSKNTVGSIASKSGVRSREQLKNMKAKPVTPPRETSEESFRSISVSKSDSENEASTSPKLSRLNYLAEKYRIEKPRVKLEPDTDGAESLDGSICKIENAQRVQMEPITQFVRMIGPARDFDSKRDQEVQWQTQIKMEAEMDQEIRDALNKGRRTLDRSRIEGGLDYLGSFRTDYQDEVRPTTLVSDQRETKLLNRLGPKPDIKEEPKMNGSLTILNETGERKTTSLTEHDRTVIRLNKYDSVYKRLGPEQKVPIQPPTVGVLGLDSPRKMSSVPSSTERDTKDEIPEHDRSCVIYDRRALKRRLPKRSATDLREMLQCKGGFIPSEEEDTGSRRESGPVKKRLDMSSTDLRGRLSRKKSPVFYRGGRGSNEERSILSSLRTATDIKGRGVSGPRLLLDRTVKDVIESRNSEDRW
ncbi:uncharacterized protein LOC142344740 [Convolutriloba macropyga]|uniref:uncharacterized protein LOC142344740 n=1 Tax=Convolutriloba macropyga TaxID=536237 RepID=UPI003F523E19